MVFFLYTRYKREVGIYIYFFITNLTYLTGMKSLQESVRFCFSKPNKPYKFDIITVLYFLSHENRCVIPVINKLGLLMFHKPDDELEAIVKKLLASYEIRNGTKIDMELFADYVEQAIKSKQREHIHGVIETLKVCELKTVLKLIEKLKQKQWPKKKTKK